MAEDKYVPIPNGSAIKRNKLSQFLSTLFGFRKSNKSNNGVEFTHVDIDSNDKVTQALLMKQLQLNKPLSSKLESLYNYWLCDNTEKYDELQKRFERIQNLEYMYLNDPFVHQTVELYADEATQCDMQDHVIGIETVDPYMTKDMYELLNKWGLTQNRIRSTLQQLVIYGDAFWSLKISEHGIENIIPLKQMAVTDRIEFDPVSVLNLKKQKQGAFSSLASNNFLIGKMLDTIADYQDVTDIFDKKLFGFEIENDMVVPAWSIAHFRLNAEMSEFAPFGTSLILGALASFKQSQSAIALQSLARLTSFPVTLYKVKTSEQMSEGEQFAMVNAVREQYDNIGVNVNVGNSESYTNNTKIWVPDGLLTVETVGGKAEGVDNIDDVDLYAKRVPLSLGLPESFYTEGWYNGVAKSGKALTKQFKPFARKVYSLQSAFLDKLSDIFKIHFAITGKYDFRVPFTLSMKYPIEEEDDLQSKNDSLDLVSNVLNMIRSSIGVEEDAPLPPQIIRDVLGKYSFLNADDIIKWTKDASYNVDLNTDEGSSYEGRGSFGGAGESDFGSDEGESFGSSDIDVEESLTNRELKRFREKQLTEKYNKNKDDIYFKVLRENSINNFVRNDSHIVMSNIPSDIDTMLEVLSNETPNKSYRLKEGLNKRKKKKQK